MIHAVLVDAYPGEAAARAALGDESNYAPGRYAGAAAAAAPYLGIWRMPKPYDDTVVHVFSADLSAGVLEEMGWTRPEPGAVDPG
jgi:hypothetical protein